jgi:hypothetical protein
MCCWMQSSCDFEVVQRVGGAARTVAYPNLEGKPPGFEPPPTLGDRVNGVRDILDVELLSDILPFVTGVGRYCTDTTNPATALMTGAHEAPGRSAGD